MGRQHEWGDEVAPWWAEDFVDELRAMGIEATAWLDGTVTTPGDGWVQAPRNSKGKWTAHVERGRRYPTALEAFAASLRESACTGDAEVAGTANAEIAILAAAKAAKEET